MLNTSTMPEPFAEESQSRNNAKSFSLIQYQQAEDVPMAEARALLEAHVKWAHKEILALGAPEFDPFDHFNAFWRNFDSVLPPKGAFVLAHDQSGSAVGTGALKGLSDTTAEMKHLYVKPEMRGSGLGRALIDARLEAAKKLGYREIVADTFKGNLSMIKMYHALGFEVVESVPSTSAAITPEIFDCFVFFRRALD